MHGISGALVASEMHGRFLDSGLYDATEKINLTILGDLNQTNTLVDYIFSRYNKYHFRFLSRDLELFEWPTLSAIYDDAKKSDFDLWYVHTKGVSNCRPDVPSWIQHNLRSWRGVMSYYVIKQHEHCKRMLNSGIDAAGPLFVSDPPYFAGNFWWSKSSHIKTLALPKGSRNEAEGWIGTNKNAVFLNLCRFPEKMTDIDLYDFKKKYGEVGVFDGIPGCVK